MAHPGLAFALIVGVAVGTFLYYCFAQETPQAYDNAHASGGDVPIESPWNTPRRSSSGSQRRRGRRYSCSTCSICLEPLLNCVTQVLKCSHEFHTNCVKEWLEHQRICPNCRCTV